MKLFHPHAPTGDLALQAGGAHWSFGFMLLGAAVQAIGRNKLRASLTMLGVFIGVAALIAMVAVGQGANEAVRKQIESLGTNLLVVMPGATTTGGVRAGSGSASTLTVADALAVRRDDGAVALVGYLTRQMGQVQYANQNWTTVIQGVSPNYPAITNWQIAAGRSVTAEDDASAALVAVIGQTVYRQLFAASDNPLGAVILVKGVPMRIVGLFVGKGQTPFGQDQDDLVMIPFSHRRTESARRGGAQPAADRTGCDLHGRAESIRLEAAPHWIRELGLCAGGDPPAGVTRHSPGHGHPCNPASH